MSNLSFEEAINNLSDDDVKVRKEAIESLVGITDEEAIEPLIKATTSGLATESWGGIIVNEEGLTSVEGVYAGGDAVTGAATVILAMGAGKAGAKGIHEYLSNK